MLMVEQRTVSCLVSSSAQTKVANWKANYGITSAGAWQYSDMRDYSGGTASQFNTAIRNGLGSATPTPTPTATATPTPATYVQASLGTYFNADGFSYDSNGNIDGSNYTYSADLVSASPTYDGVGYQLGSFTNGSNNVVQCTGQSITLTQGTYSSVRLLGASCNGNKTGTFTIYYTDGTYSSTSVAMRDWCTTSYSTQKVVQTMAHRHSATADASTANRIFAYYLTPTSGKTVASITCPSNSDMKVLAITLVN